MLPASGRQRSGVDRRRSDGLTRPVLLNRVSDPAGAPAEHEERVEPALQKLPAGELRDQRVVRMKVSRLAHQLDGPLQDAAARWCRP